MENQGIPIFMGDVTHCQNITFHIWLSIVYSTQEVQNKFFMFLAFGFRGQEINSTNSINLPFCEMWISNKASDWIHCQQYTSKNHQVHINISQGKVIDQSPYGFL